MAMNAPTPAEIHAIYHAGGFDPETLDGLAKVLGEERMQRLFRITRAEFAEALARLSQAVTAQDLDRTQNEAHALRGAAANIGAIAVADAVARYEQGLRDGAFYPGLLAAIGDALALADAALASLEKTR
jgi:HPt (histidine-containing phosphotransfer) domain-containing protein